MLLQDTFGEFDSTQRLKNLIQLICQLTGTYEVLLKAENGEEAIVHCSAGSVRNAACRNLSGLDALTLILTWSKGKYWLEELPVLPVRTLNEPLDKLFTEIEDRAKSKTTEPVNKTETRETVFEIATPPPPTEKSSLELKAAPPQTDFSASKREPAPTPVSREPQRPAEQPAKPVTGKEPDIVKTQGTQFTEGSPIAQKVMSIEGVKGIIVASMDGSLLEAQEMDSGQETAQLLALLGEALEQVGETFAKGKLVHGSIEFSDHRILVHPFKNTYIGTKINFDSSSAMIGSEIEKRLREES